MAKADRRSLAKRGLIMIKIVLRSGALVVLAVAIILLSLRPSSGYPPTGNVPNQGIYGWDCLGGFDSNGNVTSIDASCVGDPHATHVRGVAYGVGWSSYETADGVYNENYITSVENYLNSNGGSGQYIAPYIIVSAGTVPPWLLSQLSNTQTYVINKVYNWNTSTNQTMCGREQYPVWTDPRFISAWKALVAHFAARYGSDSKISRSMISPWSDDEGFHIGDVTTCDPTLSGGAQGQGGTCVSSGAYAGILQINGGDSSCGGSGGCCSLNYNVAAGTIVPGMCGSSACGNTSTGKVAYENSAISTIESDWTYQAAQWSTAQFRNIIWVVPNAFVDVSNSGVSGTDARETKTLVPQVQNIFGNGAYIGNESLGDGSPPSFYNFMHTNNQWCGYNNPVTGAPYLCGAQMKSNLSARLQITGISISGGVATISFRCVATPFGINDCSVPIGMAPGDTVTLANTRNSKQNLDGTFTVLAAPAPTATAYSCSSMCANGTFAVATMLNNQSWVPTNNKAQAIDNTTPTSNCNSLRNAFNFGNIEGIERQPGAGYAVSFMEAYSPDIQQCPVTIADQWNYMATELGFTP
jgi:hypothetical protein